MKVVIASSDKDLMQLVDEEHVRLWDAMRDKVYGVPEVVSKFGVPPSQLRDLLALVGDTSDNVPGVAGIGPKTAAELLSEFGSFDAIYARLEEVKKPRIREALRTHREEAELSRGLVTLQDVAVEVSVEALRYEGGDEERLRELYRALGFTRFLKALPPPPARAGAARSPCEVVLEVESLSRFARRIQSGGKLAVCVRGTSVRADARRTVRGLSSRRAGGDTAYVPVDHRYLGAPKQVTTADVASMLGRRFPIRRLGRWRMTSNTVTSSYPPRH